MVSNFRHELQHDVTRLAFGDTNKVEMVSLFVWVPLSTQDLWGSVRRNIDFIIKDSLTC